MKEKNEFVNEDTYQTLKEFTVSDEYQRRIEPLWKDKKEDEYTSSFSLHVCTPVHSECSIHYTQALLELQKLCLDKKIKITFSLIKSFILGLRGSAMILLLPKALLPDSAPP